MGTRGLVGTRNNQLFLQGRYHHYDSYYGSCGKEVVDIYFDELYSGNEEKIGQNILKLSESESGDSRDFLADGLFCENAYIYNEENDTLEIYRGFFKVKQKFNNIKAEILNSMEDNKDGEYFSHLIMIVDRKKHTKEQVLKAFDKYNNRPETDDEDKEIPYPEQEIIPLELPKNYVQLV